MNHNIPNTKILDRFYADSRSVNGKKLEYEIIFGNEKIVFIKAGAGGSAQGYENKYLKMALRVHKLSGATVICASNPDVEHEEYDEAEIRWVIAEKELSDFEISFIGTSDGAYQNLSLAKRFSESTKWIGINSSIITITEFKERLIALPNISKIVIYGTKDYDFDEIVPTISKITNENLVLKLVDGADHKFTGMVEEFIALVDYLK